MNDRAEKLSATWALRITIPGLIGAVIFIILLLFSSRPLRIYKTHVVPSYIPTHLITDLLLTPSGKLVALVQSPLLLDVYTWDVNINKWPSQVPINFQKLTGTPAIPRLVAPFATGAPAFPQPAQPLTGSGLPYAVSDDGSMIAWSWDGKLFAGPLREPKKFQIPLDPPMPIADLSFIGTDLVAALHVGGSLRLTRLSQRDPNLPGTEVRGFWRISGRGPFRILARFDIKSGILMNPASKLAFQGFPTGSSGTFITTSPKGKIAMGTTDGTVIFPRAFGAPRSVTLPEAGRVHTLAFHDEKNVIAGVHRGGLFLVEDDARASPLGATPTNVRLLAIRSSRIAMATSNLIAVAKLERRILLGEDQKWRLALTFSILSFFAFLRLVVTDWIKLHFLARDNQTTPEQTPVAAEPPRENEKAREQRLHQNEAQQGNPEKTTE